MTPLRCEQVPNSTFWILTEPLRYLDPWGQLIEVPTGFKTDFASVPPLARFAAILIIVAQVVGSLFWPAYGAEAFALFVVFIAEWLENSGSDEIAVVHDWIYWTRCRTRYGGDLVLYYGMAARGATVNPFWKQCFFLVNVRLFGWMPWADDLRRRKRGEVRT